MAGCRRRSWIGSTPRSSAWPARGPSLGRPFADTLSGSQIANLKELRATRSVRILFAFDPRRAAILLLGGDKADDWSGWYERMIPVAEALYRAYLDELRAEGLIE